MRRWPLLAGVIVTCLAQSTLPRYHGVRSGGKCCTYYVDNAGSDSNSGRTPTQAWQTIAKVNVTTLRPGQSVGFKRGGTWRETLRPGQGGTSGRPITFTAYGSGAPPLISAADVVTGFVDGGSNIWDQTGVTTRPNIVIIAGSLGILVANRSACTFPGAWYWTGNTLSVYARSDPSAAVQAGKRNMAIDLNGQSHLVIDGLSISGANGNSTGVGGIYGEEGGADYVVQNSVFHQNYYAGIYIKCFTGAIIRNNSFSDTAGTGITDGDGVSLLGCVSFPMTPSIGAVVADNTFTGVFARHCASLSESMTDGLIQDNTFSPASAQDAINNETDYVTNTQTGTMIRRNSVSMGTINVTGGGASGMIEFGGAGGQIGVTMENNTVAVNDNGGTCFAVGTTGGTNVVQNNICTGAISGFRNMGGTTTVRSNSFAAGATTGTNGLSLDNASATKAHYNLIQGFPTAVLVSGSGTSLTAYNNDLIGYTTYGVYVDSGSPGLILSKNNIFYTTAPAAMINVRDNGTAQLGTYDYNLYHIPVADHSDWYNGHTSTWYMIFGDWQAVGDAHGKAANPLFTNVGARDFTLQAGSPAIRAGVYIAGVSTANPPNIGAK